MTQTVTAMLIARQKVRQAYIAESLERPITQYNYVPYGYNGHYWLYIYDMPCYPISPEILDDKREDVRKILNERPNFIDRPEQHEYFQRKYGIDPKH